MSPDQISQAYTALQGAVDSAPVAGEQQIAAASAAKAPALAVGSNAYDVGRYVTPNAAVAADKLVIAAKQNMIKKVLQDAQFTAADRYTQANNDYQGRQRAYYRQLAMQNELRYQQQQKAASAASAASSGSIAGGDAGGTVIIKKAAPIVNNGPGIGGVVGLQGGGGSIQGGGTGAFLNGGGSGLRLQ